MHTRTGPRVFAYQLARARVSGSCHCMRKRLLPSRTYNKLPLPSAGSVTTRRVQRRAGCSCIVAFSYPPRIYSRRPWNERAHRPACLGNHEPGDQRYSLLLFIRISRDQENVSCLTGRIGRQLITTANRRGAPGRRSAGRPAKGRIVVQLSARSEKKSGLEMPCPAMRRLGFDRPNRRRRRQINTG